MEVTVLMALARQLESLTGEEREALKWMRRALRTKVEQPTPSKEMAARETRFIPPQARMRYGYNIPVYHETDNTRVRLTKWAEANPGRSVKLSELTIMLRSGTWRIDKSTVCNFLNGNGAVKIHHMFRKSDHGLYVSLAA